MNTASPIVHDVTDSPIPFVPVDLRDAGDVLGRAPSLVGRVDWTNIAPHPELALLGDRCRCGQLRGEHGAQAPYAATGCRRFRAGTMRLAGGRP